MYALFIHHNLYHLSLLHHLYVVVYHLLKKPSSTYIVHPQYLIIYGI